MKAIGTTIIFSIFSLVISCSSVYANESEQVIEELIDQVIESILVEELEHGLGGSNLNSHKGSTCSECSYSSNFSMHTGEGNDPNKKNAIKAAIADCDNKLKQDVPKCLVELNKKKKACLEMVDDEGNALCKAGITKNPTYKPCYVTNSENKGKYRTLPSGISVKIDWWYVDTEGGPVTCSYSCLDKEKEMPYVEVR